MKLIFFRNIKTGELFRVQRPPENMTENEVAYVVHDINSNPKTCTVDLIEIDEYGEFLLKKAEEKQNYSAECVQEALDALDNAIDYVRCLRTVKE